MKLAEEGAGMLVLLSVVMTMSVEVEVEVAPMAMDAAIWTVMLGVGG
jgi:hypothetical protein